MVPSATPPVLATVLRMVAVYTVLGVNAAAGVKVAVDPETPTVAITGVGAPAACNANVAVVNVVAFMGVLKTAVTDVPIATPAAFTSGVTAVTVGVPLVVKLQLKLLPSGTAAALVTALATVAV